MESILNVCKTKIVNEVQDAEYLAVMCDETTDVFDKIQMVIILRYEVKGKAVERFWVFLTRSIRQQRHYHVYCLKNLSF